MAKATMKSSLAGKLGDAGRKAVVAHKDDETTFDSGGRLPAGIENGVAQLVECRFGQYEKGEDLKGEFFFYASGVVVEPKEHEGIKVEGLRTTIMEPVCNTPTRSRRDVGDHIAWILNEMRKLGADTKNVDLEDLESIAGALKQEAPYFRFRTWKGSKQTTGPYAGREPRVQEVWNGTVSYDGQATDSVVDNTDEAEESADAPQEADYLDLGKAADSGDALAAKQLKKLADEAGIDSEEIATWVEVAQLLLAPSEDSESTDETEDSENGEAVVPAKDEVWYFKPAKMRKYIEVEVTAVFEGKRTCNLKNLDDNKTTYKGVSWDELKADKP